MTRSAVRREVVAAALVRLGRSRHRDAAGCARAWLIDGLMREVWRIVPPVRSMARVSTRVSGRIHAELSADASGMMLTQRRPAAAQPDDLARLVEHAPDECLDGRVESGDVAAAGEDADAFHGTVTYTQTAAASLSRACALSLGEENHFQRLVSIELARCLRENRCNESYVACTTQSTSSPARSMPSMRCQVEYIRRPMMPCMVTPLKMTLRV